MARRITEETAGLVALGRACRRAEKAISSHDDEHRTESARRDVVEAMAKVADEFGLTSASANLLANIELFDGRFVEDVDGDRTRADDG